MYLWSMCIVAVVGCFFFSSAFWNTLKGIAALYSDYKWGTLLYIKLGGIHNSCAPKSLVTWQAAYLPMLHLQEKVLKSF